MRYMPHYLSIRPLLLPPEIAALKELVFSLLILCLIYFARGAVKIFHKGFVEVWELRIEGGSHRKDHEQDCLMVI